MTASARAVPEASQAVASDSMAKRVSAAIDAGFARYGAAQMSRDLDIPRSSLYDYRDGNSACRIDRAAAILNYTGPCPVALVEICTIHNEPHLCDCHGTPGAPVWVGPGEEVRKVRSTRTRKPRAPRLTTASTPEEHARHLQLTPAQRTEALNLFIESLEK